VDIDLSMIVLNLLKFITVRIELFVVYLIAFELFKLFFITAVFHTVGVCKNNIVIGFYFIEHIDVAIAKKLTLI
jgi:hypothetical protein